MSRIEPKGLQGQNLPDEDGCTTAALIGCHYPISLTKSCQFAVLTVASGAAGLAYLVPSWKSGHDPCLWAAVATLIVVAILWRLFWQPVFHSRSEQRVLAGFLIGMQVIYVMRCALTMPLGIASK